MKHSTHGSEPETRRLFIALPLPQEARDALRDYQQTLHELGLRGSDTRPENLHITLSFLGEQADAAPIIEAMDAMQTAGPVSLRLDRPGRFRQPEGALLWLGAGQDKAVRRLAAALDAALRQRGFSPEERQFVTHITLCRRVKNADSLPRLPGVSIPCRADSIVLYQSHRPGGVLTYTPIYTRRL